MVKAKAGASAGSSLVGLASEPGMRHNKSVNTDAQVRPLPSVAPVLVRRLPLRYVAVAAVLMSTIPVTRAIVPAPAEKVLCKAQAIFVARISRAECIERESGIAPSALPQTDFFRCAQARYQVVVEEVLRGIHNVGESLEFTQRPPPYLMRLDTSVTPHRTHSVDGQRAVFSLGGAGVPSTMSERDWISRSLAKCPRDITGRSIGPPMAAADLQR
jgi:hypothetical protein